MRLDDEIVKAAFWKMAVKGISTLGKATGSGAVTRGSLTGAGVGAAGGYMSAPEDASFGSKMMMAGVGAAAGGFAGGSAVKASRASRYKNIMKERNFTPNKKLMGQFEATGGMGGNLNPGVVKATPTLSQQFQNVGGAGGSLNPGLRTVKPKPKINEVGPRRVPRI